MVKIKRATKTPRLNLDIISKFHEREYSLFTMSSWQTTFDILNSKHWYNNLFTICICIYREGVATHFRSHSENEKFEMLTAERIATNVAFRKKIIASFALYAKHLNNLFKRIEKSNTFNARFIKDYNVSFGKFCVFMMSVQRGVNYIKKSKENKKIRELLIKARTKYESIMGAYEEHLVKLCQKIAKERNVRNYKLLTLLTRDEFIEFFYTNRLPYNLKERNRISALILVPNPFLLSGKPASLLLKKLEQQDKKVTRPLFKESVLKGVSVYPGKVRGPVQVLPNPKQLSKFRQGHILVTYTTLPKYTKVIKKAKGIIADEGGLLSHAAIVSREFKIPSIVGTKIATQVLKDGDMVEVNANHGVVKVLKRA